MSPGAPDGNERFLRPESPGGADVRPARGSDRIGGRSDAAHRSAIAVPRGPHHAPGSAGFDVGRTHAGGHRVGVFSGGGDGGVHRLIRASLLYGVAPMDAGANASAAAVVLASGVVAAALPGWLAARVDPAETMRM